MTFNNSSSNFSARIFKTTENEPAWPNDGSPHVYGSVMFFILTVGFLGNVFTIIVFLQKEQRAKAIAPFVINLAVADLFMVVFGYPVAITSNLSGKRLIAGEPKCTWSAFINGSTGIASIVMLTEISVLMCYTITSMRPNLNTTEFKSKKFKMIVTAVAWIYGILSMSPPLLGWSRFMPGSAGISCGPDWESNDIEALTYNIGLMILGFFLPMTIILISYYKLYRCLAVSSLLSHHEALIRRRRHSQFKVARMVGVAVMAFVVSWSPYCVVSLVAMFKNGYVLLNGEAEIPELMAKASVIYNPLVYAVMNSGFRKTVKRLVRYRCHSNMEDMSRATLEFDRVTTTRLQVTRASKKTSIEERRKISSNVGNSKTDYV